MLSNSYYPKFLSAPEAWLNTDSEFSEVFPNSALFSGDPRS